MKRKRYTPCPVLQQHGPFDPPDVPALREQGLVCMGPYHNDKWYIFHPKPRLTPRTLREKVYGFTNKLFRR